MEYHRGDRYLSEIEFSIEGLQMLCSTRAIVKGHIPQPHPRNIYSNLCCYGRTTVVAGLCDAGVPVCLQDFLFLRIPRTRMRERKGEGRKVFSNGLVHETRVQWATSRCHTPGERGYTRRTIPV